MTLTLPSDVQQKIDRQVASGKFDSPEEVVRFALGLLEQQDLQLKRVRSHIDRGFQELEAGLGIPDTEIDAWLTEWEQGKHPE